MGIHFEADYQDIAWVNVAAVFEVPGEHYEIVDNTTGEIVATIDCNDDAVRCITEALRTCSIKVTHESVHALPWLNEFDVENFGLDAFGQPC